MSLHDDTILLLFIVLNPLLGYLARYILSGDGVIYYGSPMIYTMWHMLASFVAGFLASVSSSSGAWREPASIVGRICILGVVEAASIVSNNYALAVCSVFTNQSIKACVPLVILALKLRADNLRTVHLSVIFAVSAICNLLSDDTMRDTVQGIWLSVLSLTCVVIRMHLAQHLLLVTGVARSVVLFYQSGAAFVCLLAISALSGALSASIQNTNDPFVVVYLVISALVAAMYNMAYVCVSARHNALEVSVISTARQGAVIFASMIHDVRVSFASVLLVTQLVFSISWYGLSNEETQGFVRERLTEVRIGHEGAKKRMACRCGVCISAILAMPFFYDLATTQAATNDHYTPAALNVSMACTATFDGSARYEIMVSRFDENNIETLLRAANALEAPITFHQAVVDGDEVISPSILHLTNTLMALSKRNPCVRLSYHANVLDETGGYLTYLLERYDSLPDHVIFFKGSFRDFPIYPKDELLVNVTQSINRSQTIPYASLPTLMRPSGVSSPEFLDFKQWMLDNFNVDLPTPRHFFLRAQFIASKHTLRKYPRSFYVNLLGHGLTAPPPGFLDRIHLGRRHGSLHVRSWLQFAMECGGWESLFQDNASSTCPFSPALCALYVVG